MLARLSSMEVLGAPAVLVFEFSVSEWSKSGNVSPK